MNKPYFPLGKGQFLNLSGRFLLLSSNIMKKRAVKNTARKFIYTL
jgi:hypothetical protein